jgi:hypothetical protein
MIASTPVIISTGKEISAAVLKTSLSLDVHAILPKPISAERLINTVKKSLNA